MRSRDTERVGDRRFRRAARRREFGRNILEVKEGRGRLATRAGRARIAKDSIDMTGVEVKEAEMNALADQALADFAAREGISLEGNAAPAPATRTMGAQSES